MTAAPAICTGNAAVMYRRLGHEEQPIEEGNVCRACAAAMDEFAEGHARRARG